jgi:DNA-binding IclR family transcriptional regulator
MLLYMSPERQLDFLGAPPDAAMEQEFTATKARGYAISRGDVFAGATNMAAPIFEAGRPSAAVLISVPNDRSSPTEEARLGAMVLATAQRLSRGPRAVA